MDELPLFGLTLSKFLIKRREVPLTQRPVKKLKIFKEQPFVNIYGNEIIGKTRSKRITNYALRKEIAEANKRLKRLKCGASLASVFGSFNNKHTPEVSVPKLFEVRRTLNTLPPVKKPVKKIEFILPKPFRDPGPLNLAETIGTNSQFKNNLDLILENANLYDINNHYSVIRELNHMNERRPRALMAMYKDCVENGLNVARRRAQRAALRSRLRILKSGELWEEFIDFAFQNSITQHEIKLIEIVGSKDCLTGQDYFEMKSHAESLGKDGFRCLELLYWLNKHFDIVDERIETLIKRDKPTVSPNYAF